MSAEHAGAESPGISGRIALAVAVAVFGVYVANFRVITEGDSLPARYLPFALWHAGSFTLDSVAGAASRHPKNPPYWIWRSPEGHLLSLYPIVTPLLVSPAALPFVLDLNAKGWSVERLERVGTIMEKISAAAIGAASAGLLFVLLRRKLAAGRALLLAAGYALGTGTWAISSQALWQHGTAELLLVLGLLAVTREPEPRTIAAGLASGLLIANRPPDVLLAGALLAFLAWRLRRRALPAFLAAGVVLLPVLAYNVLFFHSVWGGYGAIGLAHPGHPFYSHALAAGVAGLLVSPARGLLVFSPFLLLLVLGPWRRGLEPPDRVLAFSLAAGVALQVLFYARTDWRAGGCYGNRFLLDTLPALLWLLALVVRRLGHASLAALAALIAVSVAIQGIGAFCYPGGHSDDLFYPKTLPRRVIAPAVWSWHDAPFLIEAGAGLARPELLSRSRSRRPPTTR